MANFKQYTVELTEVDIANLLTFLRKCRLPIEDVNSMNVSDMEITVDVVRELREKFKLKKEIVNNG